jgi:hypothetical protein
LKNLLRKSKGSEERNISARIYFYLSYLSLRRFIERLCEVNGVATYSVD